MAELNELKLPWKYVHAEGLSNYGDVKDSEGNTVFTVFGVFPNREAQIQHILERCNVPVPPVEESIEAAPKPPEVLF